MRNIFLTVFLGFMATACVQKGVAPEKSDSGFDRDAIRAVIRNNVKSFQACYDTYLKNNPKSATSGKVQVKWHIIEKGKAEKIEIKSSTFNSKYFETCLITAVGKLTFPEPQNHQITEVVYPFSFSDSVEETKPVEATKPAPPGAPATTPTNAVKKEEPKK